MTETVAMAANPAPAEPGNTAPRYITCKILRRFPGYNVGEIVGIPEKTARILGVKDDKSEPWVELMSGPKAIDDYRTKTDPDATGPASGLSSTNVHEGEAATRPGFLNEDELERIIARAVQSVQPSPQERGAQTKALSVAVEKAVAAGIQAGLALAKGEEAPAAPAETEAATEAEEAA